MRVLLLGYLLSFFLKFGPSLLKGWGAHRYLVYFTQDWGQLSGCQSKTLQSTDFSLLVFTLFYQDLCYCMFNNFGWMVWVPTGVQGPPTEIRSPQTLRSPQTILQCRSPNNSAVRSPNISVDVHFATPMINKLYRLLFQMVRFTTLDWRRYSWIWEEGCAAGENFR